MNARRIVFALIGAAVLALPFVAAPPVQKAHAAQTVMCAPNPVEGANNRSVGSGLSGTGSPSPVPSGTTYTLNGQGCTVVKQADIGYFLGLGYSAGPPFGQNILKSTGVWTGTTSILAGSIPPGSYIQHIIFNETAGNAVTGGIAVGSTSGGNDIVTAQTCGANCLVYVTDANIAKRIFSTTASQAIYITPVTAGNNANVTVTVVWGYF